MQYVNYMFTAHIDDDLTVDEDYTPGPYNVTFKKNSRFSSEFSVPITKDEDDIYTGNKDFNLTIVDDLLPLGLIPGDIISVKVTILDDECKCQNVVIVDTYVRS